MMFSDDLQELARKLSLASMKSCGLPAEVSATLKRPGVKTRDLKRQSGLMHETVTLALRMPSCCNA
jgi:hypothetical protein